MNKTINIKNSIKKIPPEILEQNDPKVILKYYCENLGSVKKKSLHEVKMLVVGEGGFGKTQIVNRLLYDKYNEHEPKTDGIDIHPWKIKIDNKEIEVNIWDFGGQEIIHATHQFFMTRRSLYILVWDARQRMIDFFRGA